MRNCPGPRVVLRRAQIGRELGLDTTVKSSSGNAKWFAPSWEMVLKHKSDELSDARYTEQYNKILDNIPDQIWKWLFDKGSTGPVTLLCYCRNGWFCHTHLIIEYAVKNFPDWFADGRT